MPNKEGSILSSSNIIHNIIWEVPTRRFDDEGLPVAAVPTEYFIPHNSYTTVLVRRSKKKIIIIITLRVTINRNGFYCVRWQRLRWMMSSRTQKHPHRPITINIRSFVNVTVNNYYANEFFPYKIM